MKTLQPLSLVAVISLAGAPYALAQSSPTPTQSQQSANARQAPAISGLSGTREVSGQMLIGTEVRMLNGDELGEVTAVVADESGYARYAVISHGGMMGFGIKRTAVPWATVQSVLQNDKLIMDRVQIEKAPVLSGDKTPVISSGTWSREADNYWNAKISTAADALSSPIVPAPTPVTDRT